MPLFAPNVTVTDKYVDTQIAGQGCIYAYGTLIVADNPVACLFFSGPSGGVASSHEYQYLVPGTYPLFGTQNDYISGFQFKNAVAGQAPAGNVSVFLYEPNRAGLAPQALINPLAKACGVADKYGGYAVFSDNIGEMMQYVPYTMGQFGGIPGNTWSHEAGDELLDITTPGGPSVLEDGDYTWTFHPRFVIGPYSSPPTFPFPYPPNDAFSLNTAWFELQLSTIDGPLFADCSIDLNLSTFEQAANTDPAPPHNTNTKIYPQTTGGIAIPMRAGDQIFTPTVIHNIPDTNPDHLSRFGADIEIHIVRKPLCNPFPNVASV